MSARYERWLIAKGNIFMPSSEAVAKFIAKLREDKWIGDGGMAVKTVENTFGDDEAAKHAASTETQPAVITKDWLDDPDREELRLVWSVEKDSASTKYPLTHTPDKPRWSLELHRALEFVYPTADSIRALPSECKCGEDLSFEWDEDEVVPAFRSASGIFAECDECSRTFDPAKESATIKNPFDGSKDKLPGGAAYRFALKVDCGESFVEEPKLAFAAALVELVEKEFGRSFYEVAALYK